MNAASGESASGLDGIKDAIRRLRAEGKALPSERELADSLNVKRHQLRRALEALRQAGDLQPAKPRRIQSAHPRYSDELVRLTNPIEVLELRLLLEPGLARLASLRASALEIATISKAATTPANAASGEVDLEFHLAVAGAARNHLAREVYKLLRQVGVDARVRIARTAPPTCRVRIAERDAEHRLVAEAIARRDPEAAESAMRAHLLSVRRQIEERANMGAFAA